ncbi:sensor histidine kinase [Kineosporia babensis]|uniref:Histidine kinase n=1 Tax=Kineosporia babensis TaxID=499548 RepID=A0A9X1SRL1_9ACTN|nr:ATP-binding protein [Kineosporia babensis]MCD5309747.1 histidine kinase [Kineosporia babensis]
MNGPPPDAVGRLAQYVLIPRIAAPGLSVVALRTNHDPAVALILVLLIMMALNYLALRYWTLLKRARRPLVLVLDQGVALIALGLAGLGTPMVLYVVAGGVLAGLIHRARPVLAVSLAGALTYGVLLVFQAGYVPGGSDFHTTITLPALVLAAGPAGVALRRLLNEQERTASQLWKLRRTAAVREERLRVARELHDSLTKDLHGVWLLSQTLRSSLERGDLRSAREAAGVIGETAEGLAGQSRVVIQGLRENGSSSLVQALQERAGVAIAGHPLSVEVHDERKSPRAGPDAAGRSTMLAVTSEALHNVVKHAQAHLVTLTLAASGGEVVLQITDDGRGFDVSAGHPGHFGLLGMTERANRSGGGLQVTSSPGMGTTVRLVLPGHG